MPEPIEAEAGNSASRRLRRRVGIAAAAAGLLVLVGLLASVRTIDDDSFAVLEGPLLGGSARQVGGSWTLAPPGLLRLTLYPRRGVELPLPQADEAMLLAADGSRYGFRGWITLRARPESWRELHRASGGAGLRGALIEAVRSAATVLGSGAERGVITPASARSFERALVESLAERGIDLRHLELDSVDFLTAAAAQIPAGSSARVLIIGLDGADWEVLDPLLEQGRLPNLKRLIDNGARAKLLSISPLLSPVIWTSVATGTEPSRHGVLDFLVEDPVTGSKQPVTSAQRKVPTFWELLSRSGVEVGVVGWWASWPADPVRGYLVSDRLAYQLFGFRADPENSQGKTWPPDLYGEIRPLIVEPDAIAWERVEPFLSGPRKRIEEFDEDERKLIDEFRTLLAAGDTYLSIGDKLRRQVRPQLEAIYFEGTDTVGHLFMPYRPPELPGVDRRRSESFAQVVDRYYELADGFVGTLLAGREGEWTVMILSDHGFASDATRPRSTDSRIGHGAAADWHRRFGMLVLSGAHVKPGVRLDEATIYDIAPTVLALFGQPVPRRWPGHVLAGALTDEFIAAHPVRFRAEDPERRDQQSQAMIDPAAADLLAKLESLGYISGDGGEGDSVTARNNAGVAFLAEGRLDDAEREFRAGLEENPGMPMLTVNLGMTLRLKGQLDEAARLFEQALQHPTTLRVAGHSLAQLRMDGGDLEEAERLVGVVLQAEPDAAEVRNTFGLILEKKGDLDAAREQYRRAADLDPDAALARNNLGNLAKQGGDLADAESWYLRAIEADPYFMGAYNNLALVYQARGEMDKAIDLYGRALGKSPNNAVVLNNLASLHYAQGDHEEARRLWAASARTDPSYPSPLNNLASLEINAQRYDEAVRLLRKAIDLDADYGDARINLAMVHRFRDEFEQAREEYRRATQDPRTGANSWLQLGLFEMEQGRPLPAAEALEGARQREPRRVDVLNALGESYYRSGRTEQALEAWRHSLELSPDQTRLRQVLEQLDPQ